MKPELHKICREACLGANDTKIRHHGKSEAATNSGTLDRANNRFFTAEQTHGRTVKRIAAGTGATLAFTWFLAVGKICAGAKMFALGDEHERTHVGVFVHRFKRITHREDEFCIEEIVGWALNFDHGDMTFFFYFQISESHYISPYDVLQQFDHAPRICNAQVPKRPGMDMLRWQIGGVCVTQVVELTTASLGPYLLPQATPEALESLPWITPFLDDQSRIVLSMHSLIVESLGQTILVDTCIGNDKERSYPRWNRMQTDFLEKFAAAGFSTDTVDTVLCTHMHVDHVGWNTRLVDGHWEATFGNARYLFAEQEWAYWKNEIQEYGPVIEDSVQPIFDADMADLVQATHQVTDEVRLEPTPGHTPGHVSVHITSQGEEAIITGDMIHHPCQIAHPEWSSTADWDQSASAATRIEFLSRYADKPVLIIGTHFAAPTAGRIVRDGQVYRLDY